MSADGPLSLCCFPAQRVSAGHGCYIRSIIGRYPSSDVMIAVSSVACSQGNAFVGSCVLTQAKRHEKLRMADPMRSWHYSTKHSAAPRFRRRWRRLRSGGSGKVGEATLYLLHFGITLTQKLVHVGLMAFGT